MSEDLTRQIVTAAEAGDLAAVQAALDAGASPDAMGPNSGALHTAAFEGHLPVVALLLAKGASTAIADKQGFYPLQLAASKNRVPVIEALLAAKADTEARTPQGGTALHVAAASGHLEAADLLIKAGADVEARDHGDNTTLHTALSMAQAHLAKRILKAKADTHNRNKNLETPLIQLARGLKRLRVKQWSSQGTNQGQPVSYQVKDGLFTYTKDGHTSILSLDDQRYCASQSWGPAGHLAYLDACDLFAELSDAGLDYASPDQDGHTPLALICHTGEARLIQQLIALGADTRGRHIKGITPLHLVAGSGRHDGLEAFLDKAERFDINAPDSFGWTPLHYLADIGGDISMAQMLLAKGADKHARSTETRGGIEPGATPADVARHWRDHEMAKALD